MRTDQLALAFDHYRNLKPGPAGVLKASDAMVLARTAVANGKTFYCRSFKRGPKEFNRYPGNGQQLLFVERPEDFGLRWVDYADQLATGIGHTGWHTRDDDGYYEEKYRGCVWQISAKDGERRLICGFEGDGVYGICVDDTFTASERDFDCVKSHAAEYADQTADIAAREAREFYAADAAGQHYAQLAQDNADKRQELFDMLPYAGSVTVRKAWRATCEAIGENESAMDKLWTDCPVKLEEAFKQGADGFADHLK